MGSRLHSSNYNNTNVIPPTFISSTQLVLDQFNMLPYNDTTIDIVQDYIYLQLNPEFNMNAVAVSGKEDRSMCLDSAGQESKYFSKIILNDFGNYCRTAVQMPKTFNPVLGKYETLSCQLVDRKGNNISSVDCEYDFVLEVVEIVNGPADTESLLTTTADLNVYAKN